MFYWHHTGQPHCSKDFEQQICWCTIEFSLLVYLHHDKKRVAGKYHKSSAWVATTTESDILQLHPVPFQQKPLPSAIWRIHSLIRAEPKRKKHCKTIKFVIESCCGLALAGCHVPTKMLYHLPPQWDRGRKNTSKAHNCRSIGTKTTSLT